jgi:hypothetical protein
MRKFACLLLAAAACGDTAVIQDGSTHDLSASHDMIPPPPDMSIPDSAGIQCGQMSCGAGQVCCLVPTGGTMFSAMCADKAACNTDAGAALQCDGPEDCSSATPTCCIDLQLAFGGNFGGDGGGTATGGGNSQCVATCTASVTIAKNFASADLHTRLCHQAADCTGLTGKTPLAPTPVPFDHCCTQMGSSSPQFCAPAPAGPAAGLYNCQ